MYVTREGLVKERPDADKIDVILGFSEFPREHTCSGENRSPEVQIEGLKTEFLAIVMDDPGATEGTFTHWIAWDVETDGTIPERIPKNDVVREPIKAIQGRNSANKVGYMGPCPPKGTTHRYFFKVYAYNHTLNLKPGSNIYDLMDALENRYSQFGQAIARFMR